MLGPGESGRGLREKESGHVIDDGRGDGTLREDILGEKVLSAIVEIKAPVKRLEEIIRLVVEVEKRLDTVVAIGVGARCDGQGEDDVVAPILKRLGYRLERAKTNAGLGRATQPRQGVVNA